MLDDVTLPNEQKPSRFSRKNVRRVMYHPTPSETFIWMGSCFLLLSILLFFWPSDDSNRGLGDAIIHISSSLGVPQYVICLVPALFFYGLVAYVKLNRKSVDDTPM